LISEEKRLESMIKEFENYFSEPPTMVAIAPGRVNLIGEHTDYNDGYVLPVALTRDVRLIVSPRRDRQVRIYSLEYSEFFEFNLDVVQHNPEMQWSNYIQGVAQQIQRLGIELIGLNVLLTGNVPRASGLSSSAALEIATATAFLTLSKQPNKLTGPEIARLAQLAENEFVGVNCGIMDQFISVLGTEGHALLIDCRSLEHQLTPFPEGAAIVIGNTKASRALADSAYNERRTQCEEAVRLLQNVLPDIQALRDVSIQQLEENQELLPPIIYQRCHHVVHENERVLQTVEALAQGDLAQVGKLMNASHVSLRDDYEVSSQALDAMVEVMQNATGCYGARLTGAGFGGCAVALVEPGQEQAVADAVFEGYAKLMNVWPEVYTTRPARGAYALPV